MITLGPPYIYLAGANTRPLLDGLPPGTGVLESFADPRRLYDDYRGRHHWVLDCGAFSVYRGGGTIDLAAYADYVRQRLRVFDWYLSVDVIGGTELENLRNYEALLRLGLAPVPVWHEGESEDLLYEYLRTAHRVAFGSLWPKAPKRIKAWLARAPRLEVPVHGLALVQHVHSYPWESVDSRSWSSACAALTGACGRAPLAAKVQCYLEGVMHAPEHLF